MQISDKLFFQRCYELASLGGRNTRPNPMVGSVIVYNNRIIGEGYHKRYGDYHAEVEAVENVKDEDKHLISKSTIYISLEPCFHFGKTPPCVNMIIKNKIPKVKIALPDPTKKVYYKSIRKLEENDIDVTVLAHTFSAQDTIHEFLTIHEKKRPFVQIKVAKSAYNYMGRSHGQVYLTNKFTNIYTHKLRSYTDAILIGTNTAKIDDPSLTLRNYPGKHPIRIVLDRKGDLPSDLKLLTDELLTIIISENKNYPTRKNKSLIILNFESDTFLDDLLSALLKNNIYHLIVEGGSKLIRSFIKSNCWDEAVVISTKHPLNEGVKCPQIKGRLVSHNMILNNEIHVIKKDI